MSATRRHYICPFLTPTNRFCGGRDIDIEIAKYVAQEAKRKCGVDVVATRNLRGGTLEAALEATTNSVFNTYKGKPPSKDIEDFLSFKNGEPLKRAIKKDLMANVQNLLNSAEITKKQIGGGGESCEVSIAIPGEGKRLVWPIMVLNSQPQLMQRSHWYPCRCGV